jgi:hypothetical protein
MVRYRIGGMPITSEIEEEVALINASLDRLPP